LDAGKWTTTQPGTYRRSREYVAALEQNGRYPLCVWPYHCLIGSPGHAVVPELFAALTDWESGFAVVDYVTKGSNIWTEHYSAVVADVPDPEDPSTQINTRLIQTLMEADLIFVAGEAGSHCLANTVRDIANNFGDDNYVKKLVLLTDATSPVPGFETYQDDFLREMTARGMQTATTTDFLL
jgi:nicotinamidase/pyrazinamidase